MNKTAPKNPLNNEIKCINEIVKIEAIRTLLYQKLNIKPFYFRF